MRNTSNKAHTFVWICFALLCCYIIDAQWIMWSISYIFGFEAITKLPGKYRKLDLYITTPKHNKARILCVFSLTTTWVLPFHISSIYIWFVPRSFAIWFPCEMPISHCPGALLVSILTSNKTWRTRNAVRSSNGDCEKTTQHFAMMSASDLFIGCMWSSMAS